MDPTHTTSLKSALPLLITIKIFKMSSVACNQLAITPYRGLCWTYVYGLLRRQYCYRRYSVPCGRAGVCFQLTNYCTRHLNNSVNINYHYNYF